MGSSSPSILEISSDEEFDFGVTQRGVDGGGGGESGGEDYFDWLSELLGEVGGDKNVNENDDSDEVVVVGEVLPKKPKNLGVQGLKLVNKETLDHKVGDGEDDDDDCVILDGDPVKPVAVVKEKVDNRASGDNVVVDDDLQIVSEKGEVACRDFPHPRHLCAKFPFNSTSHEVHCPQCHCYVCDSLAPCSHWGTGKINNDHCHASDVSKHWKTARNDMKQGKNLTPSPPQPVGPLNHIIRPTILRPCSVRSANYGAATNAFTRPPANSSSISRFLQMQSNSHSTNVAPRGQGPNVGRPVGPSFAPRAAFKRPGPPVALPSSKRANTSQVPGNISPAAHQMQQIRSVRGVAGPNRQSVSCQAARSVSPRAGFPASSGNVSSRPQSVAPRPHSNALLTRTARESVVAKSMQGLPSRPVVGGGPQKLNVARPVYPNQHVNPAPPSQSGSRQAQARTASGPVTTKPLQGLAPRPVVGRGLQKVNPARPVYPNQHFNPAPPRQSESRPTQAQTPCESVVTTKSLQGLPSRPVVGRDLQNTNPARPVYPNQHVNPAPLYQPAAQYASGYTPIGYAQNGEDSSPNGVASIRSFSVGSSSVSPQVLEPVAAVQVDNSGFFSTVEEDVNFQQQQQKSIHTDACLSPVSIRHDSLELDLNGCLLGNSSSSQEAFAVPLSPVWNSFSPEPGCLGTDVPFDY